MENPPQVEKDYITEAIRLASGILNIPSEEAVLDAVNIINANQHIRTKFNDEISGAQSDVKDAQVEAKNAEIVLQNVFSIFRKNQVNAVIANSRSRERAARARVAGAILEALEEIAKAGAPEISKGGTKKRSIGGTKKRSIGGTKKKQRRTRVSKRKN